jgi:hypothetical protein
MASEGSKLRSRNTAPVIIMIAISAPGSLLEILGVRMMIASEANATPTVGRSILSRLLKYTPHFEMKSPGRSRRPMPRKSFTCVDRIVRAIPAVNPTTMG